MLFLHFYDKTMVYSYTHKKEKQYNSADLAQCFNFFVDDAVATATGVPEPEEGLSAMGGVLDISKVEVDELQRSPELLYSVEGFILLYGIHLD